MKTRIKIAVAVLLCSVTAVISFTAVFSSMKAGDVSIIGNEHTKAFSTEFTELVPYGKDEDSLSWFDGMATGNGENAKINMTLSVQDCWSLRGFGNGGEKDMLCRHILPPSLRYVDRRMELRLERHLHNGCKCKSSVLGDEHG